MKTSTLIFIVFLAFAGFSCKPKTSEAKADNAAAAVQTETQKMITAKVFIKPGFEEEFAKSAQWIIDSTHKEEGCLEYTLYQDPYNKTNFFFFERYKNQAAIDAHFAAPYFKAFGDKASAMISQPTEIKIWDITENR